MPCHGVRTSFDISGSATMCYLCLSYLCSSIGMLLRSALCDAEA